MAGKNIHFDISERKVLLRFFDVISVLAGLYLVGYAFDFDYFKFQSGNWTWPLVLSFYLALIATIFELYDLQKASKFHLVFKNVMLTTSVTVLLYLLTPFFTPTLPGNRLQIVYFFLSISGALLIWRYAYVNLIATPRFYKKILLVAHRDDLNKILDVLYRSDPNYRVVAFFDSSLKKESIALPEGIVATDASSFETVAETSNISEIVVATRYADGVPAEINRKMLALLERGMYVRAFVQVYEELTYRVPVHHVEKDFYRYFPFSRSNKNKFYLIYARILDLFLSIVGLALSSLLIPLVLVGNYLGNRGPLLYHQTRVGKNGNPFKLYKLRSMVTDAEREGVQFAQVKDGRVTKFGRILRRSRIDEIPQFVNVIKGDMSLIGPRPERPEFVCNLIEKIPFYEVRHIVKPGITGWAQVKTKYGACEQDALEKLQYDLYYIKHRGLFLDLSILIKTLSTIVFFRGQ